MTYTVNRYLFQDPDVEEGQEFQGKEPQSTWQHFKAALWWCDRNRYSGALIFNFGAFLLPALYETISKSWVAAINPSEVVITDVYVYIIALASVLNDGLPRAAWSVIGDNKTRSIQSRISLSYTLILIQVFFGSLLCLVLIVMANQLADTFVKNADRKTAVTYVRISSVAALSSAMETAVSNSTRALDRPDVPFLLNLIKFIITGILDAIIISRARAGDHTSVTNHALVRMTCNLVSAAYGLGYFRWIVRRMKLPLKEQDDALSQARPCLAALIILVRHGIWTFGESMVRNSLYLWLVHSIIRIGKDYAIAWGVFNTMRGGLLMVPLQALETSTLTFIGHAWGVWRSKSLESQAGAEAGLGDGKTTPIEKPPNKPEAELKDIFYVINAAWASCSTGLAVEIFLFFLFFWAAKDYAFYLSESHSVAEIVQNMWRTMDWCYIFYGISSQLAAILIATTPRFFFAQSLVANILWMLPWAIACSKITMSEDNAWTYHGIAVGGSLLANFVTVLLTCVLWAWMLTKGWVSLLPVTRDVEDEEAKKTTRMEQEQARKQKKTDKETAREVKREARRTAKYGNDAENIRAVQTNPTTTLEPPSNRSLNEVGVNMEERHTPSQRHLRPKHPNQRFPT